MPDDPDRELGIDATITVHFFLMEMLFQLIFEIHPDGRAELYRKFVSAVQDIMKRTVANPYPLNARDVQLSDEAEEILKAFLLSLSNRMKLPLP